MMCSLRLIAIVFGTFLCRIHICVGDNPVENIINFCQVSGREAIMADIQLTIKKCGEAIVEHEGGFPNSDSNSLPEPVYKKICRNQEQVIRCLEDISKVIDPCFQGGMKIIKSYVVDAFEELLEFSCEDEGELLGEFALKGGKCMSERQEDLKNCFESTVGRFQQKHCTGATCQNPVSEEDACRELHSMQKCVASNLRKCEDGTTADFVEGVIHAIIKSGPCDKHSGGSVAHPLAQTVISTLILLVSAAVL